MEQTPDLFAKAETIISDAHVIIQPVDRKNGILSVQVVGNKHTPEQLDSIVTKLQGIFGDVFEMPDHPGASHIRLGKITSPLTPRELIKKIEG